jgi:regulator of replication initiation timing
MQVSDVPGRRDPSASFSRRCPVCGNDVAGGDRFCGSCGGSMPSLTSYLPPKPALDSPLAVASPQPDRSARKKVAAGWIVAALVLVAGTAAYLTRGASLSEAQGSIEGLESRVTDLESRNAKLKDEIGSLNSEGTNLRGENDSLKTAVTDCRDAAVQMQKVFTSLYALAHQSITLEDWRAKLRGARETLGVCRSEAQSNGLF